MTRRRWLAVAGLTTLVVAAPHAQTIPAARVAILQAESRGAREPRDLATLRAGLRNPDSETARAAIRALGRLGRPALAPDIALALKFRLPELRAEAADALASSLSAANVSIVAGTPPDRRARAGPSPAPATAVAAAFSALLSRLAVETEPIVRAAICEALGRIPYGDPAQLARAEGALLSASHNDSVTERLGLVKGFEALIRINVGKWSPGDATIASLRALASVPETLPSLPPVPIRDARIRRLALEALITAGQVDSAVMERAAVDPDPQVRRLAMRAAAMAPTSREEAAAALAGGRHDLQAMVRTEALRGESTRQKGSPVGCQHLLEGAADPDTQVALVALDLLGDCGAFPDAVVLLERTVSDVSVAGLPRTWQRTAHGLVALSRAAPDRARAVVGQFTESPIPPLRAFAARAAIVLDDRSRLEQLATDTDDRVAQAGADGLGRFAPGVAVAAKAPADASDITIADLQRYAVPRARVTIRDVGSFEIVLFTAEAPATVLRFVRLAQAGYYDGKTLADIQPTVIGLAELAAPGPLPPREIGTWPHVRGTLGLSSGEAETGGAEIFIDLVDNPRFDHRYAVFAQVLNGIEVLDRILEGDVIERIEILTGR